MTTGPARSPSRMALRALVPLAVAGALAAHLFLQRRLYRCPVALVTHQPCPTCGLSRATLELLHLHFGQAFREHPLVFAVAPYLAMLVAVETVNWVRRGELGTFLRHRAARVSGFVLCVLLFALWIARFFGAFGGKVIV